jgi:hypothetical protein
VTVDMRERLIPAVHCIHFRLTDRIGYLVTSHFGGSNLDLSESDDDANFVPSVHSIESDCMLSIIANMCRTARTPADKMYPPADDFYDDGSNTSDLFQSHGARSRVDEYFHGNNTPLSLDTIGQSNRFWEAAS